MAGFKPVLYLALFLLALSSCMPASPPPRVWPAKNTGPTAGDAIEHLALAQLDLAEPGHEAVPQADIDAVASYMARPGRPERRTVAVLDYKTPGSPDLKRLFAPIPGETADGDFSALLSVMGKLGQAPYTLHDVHIRTVTIVPDKKSPLISAAGSTQTRNAIMAQQQRLLETSEKLPALEAVRRQLGLIEFFMEHRLRDAAYLTADNAKQLLAAVPQQDAKTAETVRDYSLRLEDSEARLHRSMPLTLSD